MCLLNDSCSILEALCTSNWYGIYADEQSKTFNNRTMYKGGLKGGGSQDVIPVTHTSSDMPTPESSSWFISQSSIFTNEQCLRLQLSPSSIRMLKEVCFNIKILSFHI